MRVEGEREKGGTERETVLKVERERERDPTP